MSKFLKFIAWTSLAVLLASLVMGGVLVGLAQEGLNHAGSWHVVVDGEDISDFVHLGGLEAEHGVLGLIAAALALGFTLVVVLPLVLVVGIGVPVLAVLFSLGLVAVVLAGTSALLLAPLALPVLLIVWLVKRKQPAQPASA